MEESSWGGVGALINNPTDHLGGAAACASNNEPTSKEDHVVWVIVPNAGSAGNSDNSDQPMVISSTTETVVDSNGNKTNIQIAEITHKKRKVGRKNNTESKFVCDICGLKYSRNFNLRRHKDNVHGTNSVSICCPYCTSTFTRHDNLTQHIKFVHNGMGNHTCAYCGKGFTRKHTMEEHVNVQHYNQRKYQCFKCSKVFGYPWSLYNHVRVKHESNGAFKCYYCSKVFATIRYLRNHVLSIHEGVRYKCKICNKILKCHSAYKSHLKMFHLPRNNVDQYFCSRCTHKCTTKAELVRHMISKHKWREINVCPICHKPVKHKSTFERHLMVHNQNDVSVSNLLRKHVATIATTDSGEPSASMVVTPESSLTEVLSDKHRGAAAAVVSGRKTRSSKNQANPTTTEAIFQCSHCPKVVQSRPALDRHYSKSHAFICKYCSGMFLTREAVNFHVVKFHEGEVVKSEVKLEGREEEEEDVQVDEHVENPMWSLEELAACAGVEPGQEEEWIVREEHSQESELGESVLDLDNAVLGGDEVLLGGEGSQVLLGGDQVLLGDDQVLLGDEGGIPEGCVMEEDLI